MMCRRRKVFEIELSSFRDLKKFEDQITYPVRVLPLYVTGKTVIPLAENREQLYAAVEEAWVASPIGCVIITNAGT